ncbi:unnamed protein product, partial [Dicrocoelium dendriticum]
MKVRVRSIERLTRMEVGPKETVPWMNVLFHLYFLLTDAYYFSKPHNLLKDLTDQSAVSVKKLDDCFGKYEKANICSLRFCRTPRIVISSWTLPHTNEEHTVVLSSPQFQVATAR